VATTLSNGFHLPPPNVIEAAITPKTRAILYSNPANPTGTVYTKMEIEVLVSIAKKHGLFLIADEVYREFIFVARPHVSLFNYFSQLPNLAIVVDSLSKRYSLCGARLGIIATNNQQLLAGVKRIAASRLSAGLIDQQVGAALMRVPAAYIKNIHKEYKHRRDLLYEKLKNIDGIRVAKPEGAFYVIAQLPVDDADAFCQWLLEVFRDRKETVMLAPGPGFYQTPGKGKQEVRIAYVLAEKKLLRATQILKKALTVYVKLGNKKLD
jgi:aspartate aminotransferase